MDSENLTFYTDNPTSLDYSNFVESLRGKLTFSTLAQYNLPLLANESQAQTKLYLMVDLSLNQKVLTLALDVVNLNLVAFKFVDKAYFFDNTWPLEKKLFDGTVHVHMLFDNTYHQDSGLGDRTPVQLGKFPLQDALRSLMIYDQSIVEKIKTSLITVIQMVSEATRLRIVQAHVSNFFMFPTIIPLLFSFEDKWSILCYEIQKSDDQGNFPKLVDLDKGDGTCFTVTNVSQVIESIGILKKLPA